MFVKICGLGSKEQVKAAVEAGADAIGFVFADSVRKVEPRHAAKIARDVPSSVKRVAVMLHPSNDDWQSVLGGFRPDVLQSDVDDFAELDVPDSVEFWPVYREGNVVTVPPGNVVTVPFVYEGGRSGQGETVDWVRAAELSRRGKMILAGGLSAANVGEAIRTVRPFGVDVSSGVESAPGEKDATLINEFITAAKAAEKDL
ncbi:MAG: phosphoribosylanthranilate isomerase [Woeseiaceae bacterium]|nr:phosphoribosylanthranilate isomerase [Woeseiaceae bacterium]